MELQSFELKDLIKSITREVITILLDMNMLTVKAEPNEYKTVLKNKNELIVEKDVEDLYSSGIREIQCVKGCIITPLAKDRARELGISIIFHEKKGT